MASHACLRCGRITPDKVCDNCAPNERPANASWSKGRDRKAQRRFRQRMIREFGGQCGVVVDGVRCPRTLDTHPLEAHHLDGLESDRGILVCQDHHAAIDNRARVTRGA